MSSRVNYTKLFKNIFRVLHFGKQEALTFRILCPDYKDFKIYLGFASLCFYPEIEKECIDRGIAVIKQVGDTVVMHDENLKTF
jgi:hypothetical protein